MTVDADGARRGRRHLGRAAAHVDDGLGELLRVALELEELGQQPLLLLRRLKHLVGLRLDHGGLESRQLVGADFVQLGLVLVEVEQAGLGVGLGQLDQRLLFAGEMGHKIRVPDGRRQEHLLLDAKFARHDQRANPHAQRHAVGATERDGRLEQLARARVGELRLDDRQELMPA